jgi:hypothetical protein
VAGVDVALAAGLALDLLVVRHAARAARLGEVAHGAHERVVPGDVPPQWVFTTDQNVKGYYRNSRMGERLALSVGMGTGFRGDCVVVDDPLKVMDAHSDTKLDEAIAWWDTSMSSRLNDLKTGAHLIIMQRLHERDLTGHVLAKESGTSCSRCRRSSIRSAARAPSRSRQGVGGSAHEPGELLFPKLFPPRCSSRRRRILGSWATRRSTSSGRCRRPAASSSALVQVLPRRELPPVFNETLQSWDMAFKKTEDSDFVVGQTWKRLGANCYLMRERRGRMGFSRRRRP